LRGNEKYKLLLQKPPAVNILTKSTGLINDYQPHVYRCIALYNSSCRGIGCAKDGYFLIKTKFAVVVAVREDHIFRYFSPRKAGPAGLIARPLDA
jgi:hypothetical protein